MAPAAGPRLSVSLLRSYLLLRAWRLVRSRYLVHAPFQRDGAPFAAPLPQVWEQMEALVDKGLARAIGVSNWRVEDLARVYDGARIKPCCNQVTCTRVASAT